MFFRDGEAWEKVKKNQTKFSGTERDARRNVCLGIDFEANFDAKWNFRFQD